MSPGKRGEKLKGRRLLRLGVEGWPSGVPLATKTDKAQRFPSPTAAANIFGKKTLRPGRF